MKRAVPPASSWAGHTFSIGWPSGFPGRGVDKAELAARDKRALTKHEKQSIAGAKAATGLAATQHTAAMRAGGLETLPRGRGTLGVFAPKTVEQAAKVDKLRRGRSI